MVRRSSGLALGLALAGLCLWPTGGALAQSEPADPNQPKKNVGFAVGLVSPGGTYAYVPGRWGTLHVQLKNPTDKAMELIAATYFDGESTLQYGRRMWVPARSRLETWHPVLLPKQSTTGTQRYNFQTLVMDTNQAQEVLLRSDSGFLQHDGILRATNTKVVMGVIDGLAETANLEGDETHELLVAVRSGEQLNRYITNLGDRIFTPGEESLDALDNLVIVHDRVVDDAAGLAAIRRWLYGGGRLWVMLDRVDPRVLEMLLGDEFQCEVVDRVGLTTVNIEAAGQVARIGKTVAEHEVPVDLLRVIAADVEPAFSVNGWPAAFWKTCGRGRLLVTTLGARGWMRPRGPGDRPRAPPPEPTAGGEPAEDAAEVSNPGRYVTLEPMQVLGSEFCKRRPEAPVARDVLETRVQEYVGYSIPQRWLVVGLLVGFSVLLAAAGALLWKTARLEWLGLAGPVLALAISGVLVGIGKAQRQAVPPTVASAQFVTAIPGSDDVRIDGIAGLYAPDTGLAKVGGTRGGWILPDMTGLEGQTRRMVWNDLDHWQWENLPQSAGLRMARFEESGPNAARLHALARFGPEGLTGRLEAGGARDVSDAIVATLFGRIGVDLQPDGTFQVRADDTFSPEQYLGAKFLSDEQRRRLTTLENLMPQAPGDDDDDADRPTRPENPRDYPPEPMLLFWSSPWNIGFEFDAAQRPEGAALVAVPLRFERPAAGTEVVVPIPLLPFREERGPDGIAPSGMYGNTSRVWNRKSFPASTTWLRYQVPRVLLPAEPVRGRIRAQVKGPIGRLELRGAVGDRVGTIKTWVDPVGSVTVDVTDPSLLGIGEDGGLFLGITGGDDSRPELTQVKNPDGSSRTIYWKIESLSMELTLKVLDPESSAGLAVGAK